MTTVAGGGKEEALAVDIEGEEAECLTRFTSRWPSADQRSTVKTKEDVSTSLSRVGKAEMLEDHCSIEPPYAYCFNSG